MVDRNISALFVLSLALALVILAVYTPWWSIRTANEAEVTLGGTARIDFNIWQRVLIVLRINRTRSVAFDISEFVSNVADLNALRNVLDVTSKLAAVGLALTVILWVLMVVSAVKRPILPRRIFTLLVIVSGLLLLVAPMYMFSSFYPLVTRLEKFSSFNFPSNWVMIRPQDVTSFWGSYKIPGNIGFPSYLVGSNFWIWGAGPGWYLSFTSGLIILSLAVLMRETAPKKAF